MRNSYTISILVLAFLISKLAMGVQLTEEEFKKLPLVSSVTRTNKDCPGTEETEEVRLFDGGELQAVYIHDFPILTRSLPIHQESVSHSSGSTWEIYHRPFLNCKDQDDPYLVEAVKNSFLIKPEFEKKYNFDVPLDELKLNGQSELPQDVDDLIFKKNLLNGFFIEAGATDGETNSNTLYFELERNWTGLLVEPMPYNIVQKNRKAHVSPVCLSTKTNPEIVNFDLHALRDKNNSPISMGGIVQDDSQSDGIYKLQCFPIFTILLALGNPTVNYFILDIEGAELQVLRTIPWDKVDIEVLSVETDLAGKVLEGSRQEIIDLMVSAGYTRFDHRNNINVITGMPQDDLFVRNDVVIKYGMEREAKVKSEL